MLLSPPLPHITVSPSWVYVCARDEGAWWAAVYGVAQSRTQLRRLSSSSSRQKNGEGNGTPLQYSCLENPMDGGAW